MLFGCYRKGDANDPEIYAAGVAAVLADYPAEVVAYVTDPRTGLASSCQWLPTIAEVKAACDERMRPIWREQERQRRAEDTKRAIAQAEEDRSQRLSHEELLAKYGDGNGGWGIDPLKATKPKPLTAAEVMDKFGISQAQWDAIPDSTPGYWKKLNADISTPTATERVL